MRSCRGYHGSSKRNLPCSNVWGAVSVDLERQKRTRSFGRGESGEGPVPGNDGTAVRVGSTKLPVGACEAAARGCSNLFPRRWRNQRSRVLTLGMDFRLPKILLGLIRRSTSPLPSCHRQFYMQARLIPVEGNYVAPVAFAKATVENIGVQTF
jgi:hypothetical protein